MSGTEALAIGRLAHHRAATVRSWRARWRAIAQDCNPSGASTHVEGLRPTRYSVIPVFRFELVAKRARQTASAKSTKH